MKILLINKYHYLKGGAERSYFDTAKILADHGHEIAFFSMKHSDNRPSRWSKYFTQEVDYQAKNNSGKKIKIILNIFYNFQAKRNLEKLILKFKPEVAHLHNIYHQLSPSVISVLKKYKIPTVMTLHDYKLVCPNYNLYAHNVIYEKSRPNKYYKVLLDKAVKDSYLKSLVCAAEAYFHKFLGLYDKIDLFISPSHFLKNKFEEFGFKNKIAYLPHPLIEKESASAKSESEEKYILYFGRLSREKGIDDLMRAYASLKTDIKLYILGDGPAKNDLIILADELGVKSKIKFIAHLSGLNLQIIIKKAEFIVLPSRWYENAPYSVIEAMAMGKTVIASDLGGLKELIQSGQNGFLYKAGDVNELAKAMSYVINNPEVKNKIEVNAVKSADLKNNKQNFYNKLIKLYEQAMAKNKD